jgi:hypothetical protein
MIGGRAKVREEKPWVSRSRHIISSDHEIYDTTEFQEIFSDRIDRIYRIC